MLAWVLKYFTLEDSINLLGALQVGIWGVIIWKFSSCSFLWS